MANPSLPDLLKDSSDPLGSDNEFFLVTIVDLELATTYPIEFAWKRKDGTIAEDWSAVLKVTTQAEAAPNPPLFQEADLINDGASLVVRWTGVDNTNEPYAVNFDRVEIFAKGGSFGSEYVNTGYSFKEAGTKVISVSTGATYFVKLRAVTKRGTVSGFSTERNATTVQQLVVDLTAPAAPSSGTVTAGIDNSAGATIGFNAYVEISWTAVNDLTLRGYRIRFRENGTNNSYSHVDSPGTGTTFRLNGLSIGTTYEVGIASYDELNNTSSSYTSIGTAIASGTPFIGKNVTTVGYFGASATGDTGTFKFGYGVQDSGGTKRGLVFNSNNYWYIDSSQSALFKLGGDANNYLEWNGADFTVSGNIIARGGSFSGNILMSTTNASIYNINSGYTMNQDGTLPAGSTGFVLNSSGLQFKVAGSEKITLNATDGTITATNATITGTFKTAASGTRIQMNSGSQTNYMFLYSGEVFSSISGESDALYIKGAGATYNHVAFYGPTGTFANNTSFGSEVRITPVGTSTSATIGEFRLRNITTGTTAPSTDTGAAETLGGYGSLFLVYTA
jgi:hypothetical protein